MRTFHNSFYLQEIGVDSIGRRVDTEATEQGTIIGVWIDGQPVTGTMIINELFQMMIGTAFLSKRAVQVMAQEEREEEFRMARLSSERREGA